MNALPTATLAEVRAHASRAVGRYPLDVGRALLLHVLAASSALVGPRLIGGLVEDVQQGVDAITRASLMLSVFIVGQAVLTRFAVYASATLGERVLADVREEFVDHVLALPLAMVERAGSGDLMTRMTRDVAQLSLIVQRALPDAAVAVVVITVTIGGIVMVSPLLAMPCLVAAPILWIATRWYLARAVDGYMCEAATYSELTSGLSETVEGARTVEALRIAHRRIEQTDQDIANSYEAERYTMMLRSVYLPISDIALLLPVVATLLIGGWLHIIDLASVATVTAATLYTQQLTEPVDRLLFWLTPLQSGAASYARIIGVGGLAKCTADSRENITSDVGDDTSIIVSGVHYGYRDGNDVLHDINLEIKRGERLAIVGPSGAGKSTLGRLIAGIYRPRNGTISVGSASVADLPLSTLRRQIMLVSQEQHVFQGSLRENLAMAKESATDADIERALRSIGAWEWAACMGLDASCDGISPAQSQQVALARVLLADPHALILDEATSLLDPSAAREVERSLAAVLEGRTVIAIAHQMHTTKMADRVAMMAHGRIQELGPHGQLVQDGKGYASLWRAWSNSA